MNIYQAIRSKIERNLVANFIANNDEKYIIENYQKVAMYLTTPELKINFNNAVQEIIRMQNQELGTVGFSR